MNPRQAQRQRLFLPDRDRAAFARPRDISLQLQRIGWHFDTEGNPVCIAVVKLGDISVELGRVMERSEARDMATNLLAKLTPDPTRRELTSAAIKNASMPAECVQESTPWHDLFGIPFPAADAATDSPCEGPEPQ